MKSPITIDCFRFVPTSYGQWRVSYKTLKRTKVWTRIISDSMLIDATRGAEKPKLKDLVRLKNLVKFKKE